MSDEIELEGNKYISSKRASEMTGYTQDYIGQLARGQDIQAQRVGGLWYVSVDSLLDYKNASDSSQPVPPIRQSSPHVDSLISFDGHDYISANRAAKLTGYNQDYVGQLARTGKILSRQIGTRWYVEREAILIHKHEKDTLLAAVQAQSVGFPEKNEPRSMSVQDMSVGDVPFFSYLSEKKPLVPDFVHEINNKVHYETKEDSAHQNFPDTLDQEELPGSTGLKHILVEKIRAIQIPLLVVAVLFGLASVGFLGVRGNNIYATGSGESVNDTAGSEKMLASFGEWLRSRLSLQVSYKKSQ